MACKRFGIGSKIRQYGSEPVDDVIQFLPGDLDSEMHRRHKGRYQDEFKSVLQEERIKQDGIFQFCQVILEIYQLFDVKTAFIYALVPVADVLAFYKINEYFSKLYQGLLGSDQANRLI